MLPTSTLIPQVRQLCLPQQFITSTVVVRQTRLKFPSRFTLNAATRDSARAINHTVPHDYGENTPVPGAGSATETGRQARIVNRQVSQTQSPAAGLGRAIAIQCRIKEMSNGGANEPFTQKSLAPRRVWQRDRASLEIGNSRSLNCKRPAYPEGGCASPSPGQKILDAGYSRRSWK